MCKQKWYIQFEGFETLYTDKIRISCNEFNAQMKKLNAQFKEHENDGDEYQINKFERKFDKETFTVYVTHFNCCMTAIYLYKYVAKEGYYFKSNK